MKWIRGLTLALALTVPAFAQEPQGAETSKSDTDISPPALAELGLGVALVEKNDWQGALPHFRSAVRLEPKLAITHDALGHALEHTGDILGATREYCQAAQLDPKDIERQSACNTGKNLVKRLKQPPGSSDVPPAAPSWPTAVQGRIGAKYGTRDPITCPSSRKEPMRGPISAEQAKLYFLCRREEVAADGIDLIENLTLEVGNGYPWSWSEPSDADRDSPIYPIRGSFTDYHCWAQHSAPGRNCMTLDQPDAEGKCYRTSFGDWDCRMMDGRHLDSFHHNVPPPPLR